ncbi:myeloid differentiation primary response protein MyD88 [Neocloeon triangulifer]|uniref:myeloid differentiation primary response protein MyD88 n=1 Tax=Neocloeon triangulifer TaxID=2078957 RepID=UPI00286F6B7B|nr:myeloid differentiation primary response protein MyD88 [Neocloeon triangulifer]
MGKQNLFQTPLSALKPSTQEQLGLVLDSRKVIRSKDGYLRDWRGLAEKVGLTATQQNALNAKTQCHFTAEVLKYWQALSDPKLPPNVGTLQEVLKELDRWDVHDDLTPVFELDAENFACRTADALPFGSEKGALTVDDTYLLEKGLPPQQYDVMLLYADQDIHRAKEIIENLEERHIRVFDKNRDLIPGVFEFDAVLELIANRCNKIVVIFSDHLFQNDKVNNFHVSYAQLVGIETNMRKMIPVTFGSCSVPSKLNFNFRLDYEKSKLFGNFFDKLYDSVRPGHMPPSTQLKLRNIPVQAASDKPHDQPDVSPTDSAYLSETVLSETSEAVNKVRQKSKIKIPKFFRKKKKVAEPLLA